jgi:thymidine kinase
MFLEQSRKAEPKREWVELITCLMFMGRTEKLIKKLKCAELSKTKVEISKPCLDVRYLQTFVSKVLLRYNKKDQ